jgi:hypothetical protein
MVGTPLIIWLSVGGAAAACGLLVAFTAKLQRNRSITGCRLPQPVDPGTLYLG